MFLVWVALVMVVPILLMADDPPKPNGEWIVCRAESTTVQVQRLGRKLEQYVEWHAECEHHLRSTDAEGKQTEKLLFKLPLSLKPRASRRDALKAIDKYMSKPTTPTFLQVNKEKQGK